MMHTWNRHHGQSSVGVLGGGRATLGGVVGRIGTDRRGGGHHAVVVAHLPTTHVSVVHTHINKTAAVKKTHGTQELACSPC